MRIHVGTSGWHYKHWLGDFYPEHLAPARMLPRYAREFETVEINNSFYRLPEERTFAHWKESVPPGFIFAVKASRFITHIKRLKDARASLDLLFSRAHPLGDSLGPILFQLPPRWKKNAERLQEFVELLPRDQKSVIEFRDETWGCPEIYRILRNAGVALCLHDWRETTWPREITADFSYVRFHGSGTRYGGNYPTDHLRHWATKIQAWEGELRDIFIYFNNDIGGHAVRNAKTLRSMLQAGATNANALHDLKKAAKPILCK